MRTVADPASHALHHTPNTYPTLSGDDLLELAQLLLDHPDVTFAFVADSDSHDLDLCEVCPLRDPRTERDDPAPAFDALVVFCYRSKLWPTSFVYREPVCLGCLGDAIGEVDLDTHTAWVQIPSTAESVTR